MDPMLLGTSSAFGLAASAGLNTTLPLLIVGLLARLGLLSLAPPFDALSSTEALAGLAALAALEFVADKVPGADSIVHAIQLPLASAAGAVLFASQNSAVSSASPGLAIVVGVLTAGSVHAARATARPMVTGLTVGLGNPVVSFVEDVFAFLLAVLAVVAPLLALVLLGLLVVAVALVVAWLVRRVLGFARGSARPARDVRAGDP